MSFSKSPLCFLFWSLCVPWGTAQTEPTSSEKDKDRQPVAVTLIPVGDPPQVSYIVEDDRRKIIDVPKSDIPPSSLIVKEGDKIKQLGITLNAPSDPINYKGEQLLQFHLEGEQGQPGEKYFEVNLPQTNNNFSVFLIRNPKGKTWERTPIPFLFGNSPAEFPGGSARLVNLSTVPVKIQLGDGNTWVNAFHDIRAGGYKVVPLAGASQKIISYRIAALGNNGEVLPIADTATSFSPTSRINLVCYNADGRDPSKPVSVLRCFELPQQKPAQIKPLGSVDR